MPEATTVVVAGRYTESASIDVTAGETGASFLCGLRCSTFLHLSLGFTRLIFWKSVAARWEFDVEAYDIGFKATFTPADGGAAVAACDEQKCKEQLVLQQRLALACHVSEM